jgi:hypothetical protein
VPEDHSAQVPADRLSTAIAVAKSSKDGHADLHLDRFVALIDLLLDRSAEQQWLGVRAVNSNDAAM